MKLNIGVVLFFLTSLLYARVNCFDFDDYQDEKMKDVNYVFQLVAMDPHFL